MFSRCKEAARSFRRQQAIIVPGETSLARSTLPEKRVYLISFRHVYFKKSLALARFAERAVGFNRAPVYLPTVISLARPGRASPA